MIEVRRSTLELFIRIEQEDLEEALSNYMKIKYPDYAEGYIFSWPKIGTDIIKAEYDFDAKKDED